MWIKGFTRRGLYRMKQFYEMYCEDEFVSALLTQISWTNHLMIMSKAKTVEERHFYITLCVQESYSSRELERQIESSKIARINKYAINWRIIQSIKDCTAVGRAGDRQEVLAMIHHMIMTADEAIEKLKSGNTRYLLTNNNSGNVSAYKLCLRPLVHFPA